MLLSHPQGELQVPLPPDAAHWNEGVRAFPEVSPSLLQPINTVLERPASGPPSQSGTVIHAPGSRVFLVFREAGN